MKGKPKLRVAEQLRTAFVRNKRIYESSSSFFVDLEELYADSMRFRKLIEAVAAARQPLSQKRIERLLVELDVLVLEHTAYHIKRLRKALTRIVNGPGRPSR